MSSGVRRFLSRRERHHSPHKVHGKDSGASASPLPASKQRPDHFGGIFTLDNDPKAKIDKEEDRKIQGVLARLRAYGIDTMVESNARYALHVTTSQGDGEAAFRLLMLLQETYEGIVTPYNPGQRLLGAINRDSVTCYLDALLFAMFARLDSFEALLYETFDDVPRRKLAGLLRLWVNMLRKGLLITTDVTRCIQEALAECGWQDASKLKQQDASEAFTFITGQLELPLLTLKMDLHHAGTEDPQDDHKFVNERLLEVAIVDSPLEGGTVITLEDCLEHYFNNRIEVKRHLDNQRRNTFKAHDTGPPSALENPTKTEKASGIHIEVAEIENSPISPVLGTYSFESPATTSFTKDPSVGNRPIMNRKRGNSIFSQRRIELVGVDPEKTIKEDGGAPEKERKLSTRTEVLMPAWQFFKLLPWYTSHMPTSDAQVAAHFSKKRPVLGICLKRYSYSNDGQARKLNTYVDIPTEIAVPNFVSDEHMQEDGPLVGNFRLLLQSVVCHRGVSSNSGHYITFCRGMVSDPARSSVESLESDAYEDPWMRFDDLATERVKYVDIRASLKEETPYLLFYQVQPIGDEGHSIHDLPSYEEATSRTHSDVVPCEKPYLNDPSRSENALEQVNSHTNSTGRAGSESLDWTTAASARTSLEAGRLRDEPRGRSSLPGHERGSSIPFENTSYADSARTNPTVSVPSTPSEENNATGLLKVINSVSESRRGSRVSNSKSRPTSRGPEGSRESSNRFSLNMTKLTQRLGRSESNNQASLPPPESQSTAAPTGPVHPNDNTSRPRSAPSENVATEHSIQKGSRESVDPTRQSISSFRSPTTAATTVLTSKERNTIKQGKRKARKGSEEDRDCVVM